jgi:MerR family transcriptional regulator, heat shock protein HspR
LFNEDDKSYPIELVADFLGVNSRTLYYYEKFALVCPLRRGRKRYYSKEDIKWLKFVREMMHEPEVHNCAYKEEGPGGNGEVPRRRS